MSCHRLGIWDRNVHGRRLSLASLRTPRSFLSERVRERIHLRLGKLVWERQISRCLAGGESTTNTIQRYDEARAGPRGGGEALIRYNKCMYNKCIKIIYGREAEHNQNFFRDYYFWKRLLSDDM